jgi:putative hydrolase of the HAD superfamily
MYKNYFFDLYGTLVAIRTDEQKPSLWQGAAEFYSLCGAPYTAAEIHARYLALCAEETEILAEACPALGTQGVEIELRNVFRRLFQEKGITVSATRVEDTAVLFRLLSFDREPCLMKGVKETLEELRRQGVHLYMLSNAQSCFTIPELRRLGLLDGFFDGIFLSSDFGSKKPFPAFFHAALARAGLSGSEVLMVGNDPDADIRGADAVGMKSRYIHSWQSPPRGFILPESCREIQSLEELLKDS